MKKHYEIIESVKLFKDIKPGELDSLLECMGAEIRRVTRGDIILLAGSKPEYVGVVISGRLHIAKEDLEGNRILVAAISQGEVFAESLCCANLAESPVTVLADEDSTIMLIRFNRILHSCSSSCGFHTKLIENMLKLIASKNLYLQSRMEIIAIKSIRTKVLRYLNSFARERDANITIPFNREELANYLCVERSALSHELSRMKKDGLIDYEKNKFILKGN